MNPHTYWQWTVDGLGGVANMITALSKGDAKLTKAQLALLLKHTEALMDSATRMKDKVADQ